MKIKLFGKRYRIRECSPLHIGIYVGGFALGIIGLWSYAVLFIGIGNLFI